MPSRVSSARESAIQQDDTLEGEFPWILSRRWSVFGYAGSYFGTYLTEYPDDALAELGRMLETWEKIRVSSELTLAMEGRLSSLSMSFGGCTVEMKEERKLNLGERD